MSLLNVFAGANTIIPSNIFRIPQSANELFFTFSRRTVLLPKYLVADKDLCLAIQSRGTHQDDRTIGFIVNRESDIQRWVHLGVGLLPSVFCIIGSKMNSLRRNARDGWNSGTETWSWMKPAARETRGTFTLDLR